MPLEGVEYRPDRLLMRNAQAKPGVVSERVGIGRGELIALRQGLWYCFDSYSFGSGVAPQLLPMDSVGGAIVEGTGITTTVSASTLEPCSPGTRFASKKEKSRP